MTSSTPTHTAGQPHDRLPLVEAEQHVPPREGKLKNTSLDEDVTISQKMLSAVSGSIITSLLVTPLDVVRVRLQSQQPPSTSPSSTNLGSVRPSQLTSFTNLPPNLGVTQCCREVFWVTNNTPFCVAGPSQAYTQSVAASVGADCAVEESQRKTFSSTLDGLRKIARNEGLPTLWRGLSPTLAMAVPGNVIYFAGYDWLRTSPYSPLSSRVPDVYAPLVAGSSARVLAAFFVSPIELFRTRLQASHSGSAAQNFQETMTGVRGMVSAQGYHTLWRGLTLTLWRDVPFSAFYWWGYEAARNVLADLRERREGRSQSRDSDAGGSIVRRRADSRSRQGHTSTLLDSFVAGAASGAVASIITTPFDVGKTRQQVYRHAGDTAKDAKLSSGGGGGGVLAPNSSMTRMLWLIFKDEGASGLFRGWGARCLKVAPACAIMISTYEMGKKMAAGSKASEDAAAAAA